MTTFKPLVASFCLWLASAALVAAQSAPDLVELQRRVDRAEQSIAADMSGASAAERTARERELREIKDELTYLRVKSGRGESVSDDDRRQLAERVDRFATRPDMRDDDRTASADRRDRRVANDGEVPSGTELDVRLQGRLSSKDAKVEDRVEGTTVVDLLRDERVLIPAGSILTGEVTAVDHASRTDRKGELTVRFDRIRIGGETQDLRASVVGALESEGIRGEAGRIGAGAGIGAVLGGVLGGLKGAIAGIVIGGTGAVVATEGKDVELPAGTILRVRLDSPLDIRR